MTIPQELKNKALLMQRFELTEKLLYLRLAKHAKNPKDRQILEKIAQEEQGHYDFFKSITGQDALPLYARLYLYFFLARVFGLHFGIRLMEKTEVSAGTLYEKLLPYDSRVKKILKEEEEHEAAMIDLLSHQNLQYVSSVVLGLNDALVEMIGALAGLTFAFRNTHLIAVAGLISGIAASISMGASEYLSTKEEDRDGRSPLRASIYTGVAYFLAVAVVISPYFIGFTPLSALMLSLALVIVIIAIFNFYISVAKNVSFAKKFFEMAGISLGAAVITFLIGSFVRIYLQIDF